MKKGLFTLFTFSIFMLIGAANVFAQIQDCNEDMSNELYCDTANPTFGLMMEPVSLTNDGGGFTTEARVAVYFENNSTLTLDLVTISSSIGYNSTNMSSLTALTSDAFVGSWSQSTVFDPFAGNYTTIIDQSQSMSSAKTFNGFTYDMEYVYNHTGSGSIHPPQTIAPGGRVHTMEITFTFDGTQTFQTTDPAAPGYLIGPENLFIFYGECLDPDNNINNQWGFVNEFGSQLLLNCFNSNIPTSLPLELVSFTGKVNERDNQLFWTTLSETDTKWHIIERSSDPIHDEFVEIGRVPAAGTSLDPNSYTTSDKNPLLQSYYRIKTEDTDGAIQYSNVIALKRDITQLTGMEIFPNPTVDELTVQVELEGVVDLKLQVVDVVGKVVYSETIENSSNLFFRNLSLGHLSSGVYILTIDAGNKYYKKKVIKK